MYLNEYKVIVLTLFCLYIYNFMLGFVFILFHLVDSNLYPFNHETSAKVQIRRLKSPIVQPKKLWWKVLVLDDK